MPYMQAMTPEVKAVHDEAGCFSEFRDEESLASLIQAVLDLPIDQWPAAVRDSGLIDTDLAVLAATLNIAQIPNP